MLLKNILENIILDKKLMNRYDIGLDVYAQIEKLFKSYNS